MGRGDIPQMMRELFTEEVRPRITLGLSNPHIFRFPPCLAPLPPPCPPATLSLPKLPPILEGSRKELQEVSLPSLPPMTPVSPKVPQLTSELQHFYNYLQHG